MPKSSWPYPPKTGNDEVDNFLLELFHHVYGVGEDISGGLDDDNLTEDFPNLTANETVTGIWDFSTHPTGLDHGSIGGLTDDDHSQYHNNTRGDTRYYQKSEFIDTSSGVGSAGIPIKLDAAGHVDATMINDADVDHGTIGGLSDDDHTQYHNDTRGDARYLQISNNLSDLGNAATARTNLGVAIGSDVQAYDADIDILARPSISVHKNGTNQTGVVDNTWTKVTWSTEDWDTNNDFASSTFTPTVARKYLLIARVHFTTMVDQSNVVVAIYENGVIYKREKIATSGTAEQGTTVTALVDANGSTDYYDVYVIHNTGSDKIIEGATDKTYFQAIGV
jgi:hypothetical protein